MRIALDHLRAGRSVAVGIIIPPFRKIGTEHDADNTNPDPDTRAVWIQVARNENMPIRCVLFTASPKLCEHNDTVRALNPELVCFHIRQRDTIDRLSLQMNPEKRTMLPPIAFRSFADRFRRPEITEGFQDIIPVVFKVSGSTLPSVPLI